MRVSVYGPNINFAHGATFEVHAEGCADTKRGVLRGEHGYSYGAVSRTSIVDLMYPPADFECESGEFLYDFHFAPCCAALPVTS